MDLLFVITSSAFFLWIVRNLLFWLWVLQRHDYQFTRIKEYMMTTIPGRSIWLSYLLFVKVLLVLAFIPTVFDETLVFSYHLAITALFLFQVCIFFKEFATRTLKVPRITPVIVYFIVPVILIIVLFFYNPIIDRYLWFLLMDRLLILIILLLLFALAFPLEIYWDLRVKAAREKMQAMQHCYVIAVVGEDENRITTDMIHQMFGNEQGLMNITDAVNTRRSLATVINKNVTSATRMIVISFDTVRKDELYELSHMLMPNIVVCTTIHDAKHGVYEDFFHSLPESVPVLLNVTHQQNRLIYKYLMAKNKKKSRQIVPYAIDGFSTDRFPAGAITLTHSIQKKFSTTFTVIVDRKMTTFSTPLLGRYSIMCLLPAIYLGITSGISLQEVKRILAHMQPSEGHMVPYILQNNAVLINNSKANSVDAITSSLQYIETYSGKKIVTYSPSHKLYRGAAARQLIIAKAIAQVCDHLFVIHRYFHRDIMKGLYTVEGKCVIAYKNKYKIANYLSKNLQHKDDVALFLGNDTQQVLRHVLKRVH